MDFDAQDLEQFLDFWSLTPTRPQTTSIPGLDTLDNPSALFDIPDLDPFDELDPALEFTTPLANPDRRARSIDWCSGLHFLTRPDDNRDCIQQQANIQDTRSHSLSNPLPSPPKQTKLHPKPGSGGAFIVFSAYDEPIKHSSRRRLDAIRRKEVHEVREAGSCVGCQRLEKRVCQLLCRE